jgi:MFS family permease
VTDSAPPSPFRYPAYRAFFVARLGSALAQLLMVLVIGWQVYDVARQTLSIPRSAFLLGMVGLAQFLPVFLLSLIVGVVADRVDRRHIARAAIGLEVLCATSLALLTAAGTDLLWPLFLVAVLLGVARAFAAPSLAALGPNLVPPHVLPGAIAWNAIAWQVGAVAGPVVGGLSYDIDPTLPYLVSATLLAVAMLALFRIPAVPRPETSGESGLDAIIGGLRYVRGNEVVLGAITLDLAAVILAGTTAMLPIFARDILHAGPFGFGLLRAGPAMGAALVALLFTFRPITSGVGQRMFLNVGLFSVATILFGLSTDLRLSVAALAVLGAADMTSVYIRQTLVQLHTPDAMRGRVSALATLFISASNELGEFRAGILASVMGAVAATVLGGALALGCTLLWAIWFPRLRDADRFEVPDHLKPAEE